MNKIKQKYIKNFKKIMKILNKFYLNKKIKLLKIKKMKINQKYLYKTNKLILNKFNKNNRLLVNNK